jgi:hypothetical protein
MATFEPRIYRIVLHMDDSKPWSMQKLCKDLFVTAEQREPIQEDEWGIRGVLELWFQEIEGSNITLHIQRKHSSHKKKYLKELEEFFSDLNNIDYLKDYEEIG